MQRRRKKWNRMWFAVFFWVFVLQMTVCAAEEGRICVFLLNESDRQPIERKTVYLHQVAWADEYFELYYEDAFADMPITAHELFHEDHVDNARIVYRYIQDHLIQGQEKSTDAEGKVLFEHLEEGAYLIHGKTNEGIWFEPFLIFMPTEIDAIDHYHVQATPKTTERPIEEPGQPGGDDDSEGVQVSGEEQVTYGEEMIIPQTGENILLVYGLIGVGVLLVLLGIVDMTGKGEGHE